MLYTRLTTLNMFDTCRYCVVDRVDRASRLIILVMRILVYQVLTVVYGIVRMIVCHDTFTAVHVLQAELFAVYCCTRIAVYIIQGTYQRVHGTMYSVQPSFDARRKWIREGLQSFRETSARREP